MNNYRYKATNLIAESFEAHDIKYDVESLGDFEQVLAGFSINCGPSVIMRFISRDDSNAVAVRIIGLICRVPQEKRARMMEACNMLHTMVRYMKFRLDADGNVEASYDFLQCTPDDGVGEMALEILARTMMILNDEYDIFMKALYSEAPLDTEEDSEDSVVPAWLMQMRQKVRERMEACQSVADDFGDDGVETIDVGPELADLLDDDAD